MLDALIIGGGFYGSMIALFLRERGLANVRIVEREQGLLTRASFNNQARIHNGYHYPRSFTTAHRSRVNFPRFVAEFPESVYSSFTKLYAVARRNSKVTAQQFEKFCAEIGAPLRPARASLGRLFDARLIQAVYEAQEYAFNADELRRRLERELNAQGIPVSLGCEARGIVRAASGLAVTLQDATGQSVVAARLVFNCTYSGLNRLGGEFGRLRTGLKHEITEMALVEVPPELAGVGITVMDGAFFSVMPFPARNLHSLSHVRYTPHGYWADSPGGGDPYAQLDDYPKTSRATYMQRDAARYVPTLAKATCHGSLFEVKTVLLRNETDDGRPILLEAHQGLPGCYSVLGGKIDNIFDILERLAIDLDRVAAVPSPDQHACSVL